MDIQLDTPFLLHPQLERITPTEALRPYNIPRKPGPLQNGYFTPMPMEKILSGKPNSLQNGYFSPIPVEKKPAVDPSVIRNAVFNSELDKMNQVRDEFANKILSDTAKLFNDRGASVSQKPAAASVKETKPSTQIAAKSKAEQAKLNNADWIAKYREMSKDVTPRIDPISMQSQMVAALRDPVYGQATATGLASGEGMLNSWIAGINSRARKDEGSLANERWIKQMQDADEDRDLRRQELEESKKTPVESMNFDPIYFASKEDTDKYNQMISDPVFKAQVAADPIAAFNIMEARKAKQRQIDKFNKNVKRSVMPDRKTIDAAIKQEIANADGDFTKELEALDSMGRLSKGNLWNGMFNDTDFQIKVADKLEEQRGNRATRAFKNLAQYQNMLSKTDHMNEARMLGQLIRDQLKGADPILEVIAGEAEDSPVYIRSKEGAHIFDPLRPTELLPFVVE